MQWLDQKLYPGLADNWDDEMFRTAILEKVNASSAILDIGAGAGIVSQMNFRGIVGRVCGVDIDPRVSHNPYLDEAKVSSAEQIPYPSRSFDLVFSDNVFEHLEHPLKVFAEVSRVLRPGGYFLIKTPNRWHYVALIARMTPHKFHQFINRLRGRKELDTFPTRYRANSASALTSMSMETGLEVREISYVEGRPEYLRMNSITYVLGWAYERMVNRLQILRRFRVLLIATFQKPSA